MSLHEWFDFSPSAITVGVIVLGIGVFFQWIGRWLSTVNHRWSLKWNRAELAHFHKLLNDTNALQHFLLQRLLWVSTLLGAALVFASVGQRGVASTVAHLMWFVTGSVVYLMSAQALGEVRRLTRQPELTLATLEARIQKLKKKCDR